MFSITGNSNNGKWESVAMSELQIGDKVPTGKQILLSDKSNY